MATITLTFAGTLAGSAAKTVSDADVTRLINAERLLRGTPAATNAQILNLVAQDLFNLLRLRVRQAEQSTASQAVTDITLT